MYLCTLKSALLKYASPRVLTDTWRCVTTVTKKTQERWAASQKLVTFPSYSGPCSSWPAFCPVVSPFSKRPIGGLAEIVASPLRAGCFTQYDASETHPLRCVGQRWVLSPERFSTAWTGYNLSIHSPVKDLSWVVSSFWQVWKKPPWIIMYRFCTKKSFHFSWRNTCGKVAGPYGKCMFNFTRNWRSVFRNGCTGLCFHQQFKEP